MKIEKLDLPESAIEFLKSEGFEKLYPPQADSVKSGLLDGHKYSCFCSHCKWKNFDCNACDT